MTLCEPWSHKIWRPKWLAWCDKARVRKLMTTVKCCCIRTSLNNLPWENYKPFLSTQIIKKLIRIIRIILWLFVLKALTLRDSVLDHFGRPRLEKGHIPSRRLKPFVKSLQSPCIASSQSLSLLQCDQMQCFLYKTFDCNSPLALSEIKISNFAILEIIDFLEKFCTIFSPPHSL